MILNCNEIVEKYLLIQNPLYAFSFPISVLVAIIIFGVAKAYKWSNNSYINQIIIPLLSLILTFVALNVISKMMISDNDRTNLLNLCNKWMDDPSVNYNKETNVEIDMVAVENYKMEDFNTIDEDSKIKQHLDDDHLSNDDNLDNSHSNNNDSFTNNNDNSFTNNNDNSFTNNNDNSFTNNDNSFTNNNIETPHINKESDIKAVMRITSPLEVQYSNIPTFNPSPLNASPNGNMCIEDSNGCNLCSGSNENPYDLDAPIPGPQWLPQSAESVQNRMMNNLFTQSKCSI